MTVSTPTATGGTPDTGAGVAPDTGAGVSVAPAAAVAPATGVPPQAVARMTVTLRQPAQISDRARNDFVIGTSLFLPGGVLRGAFAARWLVDHPEYVVPGVSKPEQFHRLFEGGVRFAPLFAADPPVPLSVVRHKYPPRPDCVTSTWDLALADPAQKPPVNCPDCGSALEPGKGEVSLPDNRSATDDSRPVAVRRRVHVAVSAEQVAARGQLVTRETLPAGLSFSGTIVADEPALLDALEGLGEIQIGGRRTTHGLATVQIERSADVSTPPAVRPDGGIVLTLRSPGVFVDDTGRPSQDPNPRELADLFGAPVTVARRWTRWTTVSGWHAASGLPKHTELAVAAGSTYVLTCENPVDPQTLAAVARRGLGLRRHEGYGDVGTGSGPRRRS